MILCIAGEKQRGWPQEKQKEKLMEKAEEAIAIAIEMKKDGMPISQIAKFTKLSEADIEKL